MYEFFMNLMWWFFVLAGSALAIGLVVTIIAIVAGLVRVKEVPPGKALPLQYLGELAYCAISSPTRSINDSFVISEDSSVGRQLSAGSCPWVWRFGSWVFYLYPFVKPVKYSDFNDPDKFGEGELVNLGDVTLDPTVLVAETSDGIGLNMKFKSTARVCNIRDYLTVAPRDVQTQVRDRLGAVLRAWVRIGDENHAQRGNGNGELLWEEIYDPAIAGVAGKSVIDDFQNQWGFLIRPKTVLVEDVGYDPEYQKARKAQEEQRLLAQGEAERIGRPVRIMMEQWIAQQAIEAGIAAPGRAPSPDDLKKLVAKLKKNGDYQRKEKYFENLREKALAADGYTKEDRNVSVDISSGGKSVDPQVAGILAAVETVGAALRGNRGGSRGGKSKNGGKKKKVTGKDLTAEQKRRILDGLDPNPNDDDDD